MKAVVFAAPGGPEVLSLAELPDPVPGEGEVVVRVHATALNRADLLQRRGLYPPPPGASEILGLECAGVVESVGAGATRFGVGARVMALLGGGGYAERALVPEGALVEVPSRLSLEEAAAVPEAFFTASEALLGEAQIQRGESVLVTAAASGVGSAAVQVARYRGARVVASASPEKLDFVRGLGADVALERDRADYVPAVLAATAGRGVDVILDFIGGAALAQHQACLASRGRHVLIGLLGGASAALDLGRLLMQRQRLLGLVMRTRSAAEKAEIARRFERELGAGLADGALSPRVDSVFELGDVQAAHRRMEGNENRGKIVLRVAG